MASDKAMDDKVMDEELAQVARGSGLFRHDMLRAIARELQVYRRQAQEAPKAASQSADDSRALAKSILEVIIVAMEGKPIVRTGEILAAKVFVLIDDFIKADRAAQRQAGREEMRTELARDSKIAYKEGKAAGIGLEQRYAAVVEAATKIKLRLLTFLRHLRARNQPEALLVTNEIGAFDKALSDLDEARKG